MKKWKFLTAAAALTLMLAACGDDEAKDTSAEDTGAETAQTEDKAEKKKLSFKEQKEWETIADDIAALEEKTSCCQRERT